MIWKKAPLSDLALPESGSFVDGPFGSNLKAAEYESEGVPIMRLQNIRPNQFLGKDIKFISREKAEKLGRHNYKPGDLVISKLGDPPGYACVVPPSAGSGIIVADVVRFRGNPDLVDHCYLSYFLNSPKGREQFLTLSKGATRTRVNLSSIKTIEIPLPDLDEQRRIASVLDKADVLRRQRQDSLHLTEKLIQAVFIDMFGDPVTNPKKWPLQSLVKLGTLDRGVSKHRPRNAPQLLGGPYPLIQTGDVSNAGLYIRNFTQTYSEVGFKQSKLWPKGTLCITIAANIARTGILDFDACFPDSVVGFTPHEAICSSVYVHFLFGFLQAILERDAPQVAQKNINLAILRTLEVPNPPFTLQKKFDAFVAKTMTVLDDQSSSLEVTNTAFRSLQKHAFEGELDLSRLKLEAEVKQQASSTPPEPLVTQDRYNRPGYFIAPPDIEAKMMALEDQLALGRGDSIPWSEDFFKYRILSQVLKPPFSFGEIWHAVSSDMEEADYENVKAKVFEYVEEGILEQQFDQERKELVLSPRP